MPVTLAKGGNSPLPTAVFTVEVEAAAGVPVDVSALLLAANGKVRSDADFVFYNQPTGPGVRHDAGGPGRAPAVHLDTTAVPPDVQAVLVTVSLDPDGPPAFGVVGAPTAVVRDPGGETLFSFTPTGLTVESALLLMEVYRRAGVWKVRAVGQGYAGGLAAVAVDFGVDVEDEDDGAAGPAGASSPPPTPARTPSPVTTPTPPVPAPSPAVTAAPRLTPEPATPPPVSPPPVTPPVSPPVSPPPVAAPVAPPGTPPAGPGPSTPPPGTRLPPPIPRPALAPAPPAAVPTPEPATSPGPSRPAPSADAAPSFHPAPPAAPVNLDKGRVTLRKGESVSLVKTGAAPLTRVRMGLGWDPAKTGSSIDLDASCIAFDARGAKVATVWFMKLSALDGAITHAGDNLTGEGEGDDETITVHLDRLPPTVTGLVFTVNSFLGQRFTEVARAFCRLVDDTTGEELVHFALSGSEPRTGLLMCRLVRNGRAWTMTALGRFTDGRTVRKLIGPAREALSD